MYTSSVSSHNSFFPFKVARRTLTAAGISVYMFRTCSPPLAPFRTAYINLLKILKERRQDVDAVLQGNAMTPVFLTPATVAKQPSGRVSRLLQPLSSGFVILRRDDPTATLAPTFQMAMRNRHDRKQSNDSAFWPVGVPASAESYTLMPRKYFRVVHYDSAGPLLTLKFQRQMHSLL